MVRKHRIGSVAVALLAALAVATPALAEKPDWAGGGHGKGNGHGHAVTDDGEPGRGKGKDKHKEGNGNAVSTTIITRTDVNIVRQYFAAHPVGVSPLPPGIAKNVARGKPLPPGIAKKMAPYELRQRVPACMNGWECILLGADMLILDAVHGTIADIIDDVVR